MVADIQEFSLESRHTNVASPQQQQQQPALNVRRYRKTRENLINKEVNLIATFNVEAS
jgi:hypothetical protein